MYAAELHRCLAGPFAEGAAERIGMQTVVPRHRSRRAVLGQRGQSPPGILKPDGQTAIIRFLRQPSSQQLVNLRDPPKLLPEVILRLFEQRAEETRLAARILQSPDRVPRVQPVSPPCVKGGPGESHKNFIPRFAGTGAVMVGHLREHKNRGTFTDWDLPAELIPVNTPITQYPTGLESQKVERVLLSSGVWIKIQRGQAGIEPLPLTTHPFSLLKRNSPEREPMFPLRGYRVFRASWR